MRSNRPRQSAGFTIVELLIVIVVIGILAAITVVAYSGIQARAENAKTVQALKNYATGLRLYATDNGSYPVEPAYPCLGAYPQTRCANVIDSTGACAGAGGATSQLTFDTKMKTVFSSTLPQPSLQQMNCGGRMYSGAWYHSADGIATTIVYYLKGNQSCGPISGLNNVSRTQLDDTTACYVTLPPL